MRADTEQTAKRLILGVLGLMGFVPLLIVGLSMLNHPSRDNLTFLFIVVAGSLVGPLLLPRLKNWERWRSGNRLGVYFFTCYLFPPVMLAFAGYERVEDAIIILFPLAFGLTALWWALVGYRHDREAARAAT